MRIIAEENNRLLGENKNLGQEYLLLREELTNLQGKLEESEKRAYESERVI